jgi:hypothetical protein
LRDDLPGKGRERGSLLGREIAWHIVEDAQCPKWQSRRGVEASPRVEAKTRMLGDERITGEARISGGIGNDG